MYSQNNKDHPKITDKEKRILLETAQKRLKLCIDADSHNRTAAIEDLKFINGEMWDASEAKQRSLDRRPCLQINLLNKYRNQLVGEQRNNRVRIKVRPVDSKADTNIAKIYEGIISNIEYLSKYKTIYNFAYDQAVDCGYGAWEALTRYTDENPFEQEIYLSLIKNPFLVYLDPEDDADPKYGFVITKMNNDVFDEKYPEATKPDDIFEKGQGIGQEHWYDKDTVTIARYYVKEKKTKKKALMSDGTILDRDVAEQRIVAWTKTVEGLKTQGQQISDTAIPTIVKERDIEEYAVKCYIITGHDILEQYDWPGTMIPIVLLTGRERNIEGKKYIRGFIRDAKDPQKLYNYWYTSAAEHVALSPKSPWLATAKMIEGYESDYISANNRNIPVLKYKPDPRVPIAKPERQPAPAPPAALFQAIADARQNVKDAIGMYGGDIGDVGPNQSGKAIWQSQIPGDIGTFDIFDNFKLAIEQTGRILVDMIPGVYDTERDARIRNVDDTEQFVPINTTAGRALGKMQNDPNKFSGMDLQKLGQEIQKKGPEAGYNNINTGKYGIVVDTSPSTATQRQEAGERFMQLLQTPMGNLIERIAPDLVIKNFDFLESDEFARRARKLLPPGMIETKPGEPPQQPMPPPPQVQLLMLKSQTEQTKQQTQKVALQVQMMKLYKETKDSEFELKQEILRTLAELHAPNHPADIQEGGVPVGRLS